MTRRRFRDARPLNPDKEAEFDAILAALPPGVTVGWVESGRSYVLSSGVEDPDHAPPTPDDTNRDTSDGEVASGPCAPRRDPTGCVEPAPRPGCLPAA